MFAKKLHNSKQIKADMIPPNVNVLKPYSNHLIYFKVERNYFEKVHRNEITSKSEVQTALVFEILKKFQKRDGKTTTIFCLSKTNQNQHLEFASFFHQNCIKNYIETTSISLFIKIRSNKARRNNFDFSLIEITSNKVRRNNIVFSPIKITSKK